jgi:excinuclease UvrABC nuclease subunit
VVRNERRAAKCNGFQEIGAKVVWAAACGRLLTLGVRMAVGGCLIYNLRMETVWSELLPSVAAIDRRTGENARMAWEEVPAKMACYLVQGDAGEPILLATVGDLRAALKRRLADSPAEGRSKRVEYAKIAANVRWRGVHSPFAANWIYLRVAKQQFPREYRNMISWRPTHFLKIDGQSFHPRFERSETLDEAGTLYFGPIAERRAADKLIETLQDIFDLCRYHNILVQAPHGRACAYKEMGKCPAPCDGTITLRQYMDQIQSAVAFLDSPPDALAPRTGYRRWRAAAEETMKTAAAGLLFEKAGKIKATLARAALMENEGFARMDAMSRFAYLALQPGQGKPYIEPFLIHGGTITPLDQIKRKDLTNTCQALYVRARELAAIPVRTPLLPEQTEMISLAAHHMFRADADAGVYLQIPFIKDAAEIEHAATAVLDRKNPPAMAEQTSEREEAQPTATGDT